MVEYSDLLKDFKVWVSSDKQVSALWKKIDTGNATYKDAERYSKVIADKWSSLLTRAYGDNDYSEVLEDIKQSLHKAYSESAYYAKNVQKNVNQKQKIGMKVLEPAIDDERLEHLIAKISEDVAQDASWMIGKDVVENIARSAVSDTIQANARIQSEAGLYTYVERDTGSGCCEWCESMAGRFLYGEQPDDFFRIHKNCTCTIDYMPSKKPWTRINYSTNASGRMTKNTTDI